jgi:hypothetical protein
VSSMLILGLAFTKEKALVIVLASP